MTKVPMTIRGAQLLRDELVKLKSDDRPKVIQAIAEARAHGDLKENAEYHAAKDQGGFIESRIKQIEGKLSNTQIVDVTTIDAKGKNCLWCNCRFAGRSIGQTVYLQNSW